MPQKHKLRDFIPLISIFVLIILFTLFKLYLSPDPTFMYAMQMFMASFFIIFGGFKIIKWKGFVKAYREYDILAKKSILYAYLYPLIEISLGLSYLFSFKPLLTNIVTLIIMLIGSYGVWIKLKQKEIIPCACLGVVFKIPMTKVTLFEDLLMAGMSSVMIMNLI